MEGEKEGQREGGRDRVWDGQMEEGSDSRREGGRGWTNRVGERETEGGRDRWREGVHEFLDVTFLSSLSIMTLCGFTSRCIIPMLWA